MKRSPLLGVAFALMIFAGCGDDPDNPPRASSDTAPPATAPAAPRPAKPDITVLDYPVRRQRFRDAGRSWKSCGKAVYNRKTGEDLSAIALSGPLTCTAAIAVIKALSKQVQRRVAGRQPDLDCFPGYCRGKYDGRPRPTTVAGYRCDATSIGDVSITLLVVCRGGNRYVSAIAADDE